MCTVGLAEEIKLRFQIPPVLCGRHPVLSPSQDVVTFRRVRVNREFKKTTTAMVTGTSLNKRYNEQNNGRARAL